MTIKVETQGVVFHCETTHQAVEIAKLMLGKQPEPPRVSVPMPPPKTLPQQNNRDVPFCPR